MSTRNLIAGVFMVAGCSMGAGCLAMPMLAAGPNFVFSSIALVAMGILSYMVASVSLEIFLAYKHSVNVSTIAKNNFGKIGVLVFGLINGSLMYALLAVYMSGGADLLDKTVFPLFNLHLTDQMSLLLFLLCVLPIFLKGTYMVINSNTIVFTIKLLCFLVAVFLGIHFLSSNLSQFLLQQLRYLPKALPIFFAALWFHFLIPVIARISNYDRKRCKQIFSLGITLPVILYILWIAVMLSLVPRGDTSVGVSTENTFFTLLQRHQSLGMMIEFAVHNNPHLPRLLKAALDLFSNIAMLTSFLTVGISTYDYIRDALNIKQTRLGVLFTLALTMLPPAVITSINPTGFVFILQQAAILLTLINVLLLICMLHEYKHLEHEHRPKKLTIYVLLAILFSLIALQVLDNMHYLPNFGIN